MTPAAQIRETSATFLLNQYHTNPPITHRPTNLPQCQLTQTQQEILAGKRPAENTTPSTQQDASMLPSDWSYDFHMKMHTIKPNPVQADSRT